MSASRSPTSETGEFVGEEKFRLTLRPARAAYLFREGDSEAFKQAAREASSRWLGMTEPILPVDERGAIAPLWGQILDYAKVDALVLVGVDEADVKEFAVQRQLPTVPLDEIDRSAATRHSYYPSILDDEKVLNPDSYGRWTW
jgi:hypothetical protein